MANNRLLRTLRLQNFLSYGIEGEEIPLGPLNVLIGPNGSGKSNLLEAIALLQATPKDLTQPIREGDGIGEWIWKGKETGAVAAIEATVSYPEGPKHLRYKLSFAVIGQRMEVVDEAVENEEATNPFDEDVFFFFRYQNGRPVLNVRAPDDGEAGGANRRFRRAPQPLIISLPR